MAYYIMYETQKVSHLLGHDSVATWGLRSDSIIPISKFLNPRKSGSDVQPADVGSCLGSFFGRRVGLTDYNRLAVVVVKLLIHLLESRDPLDHVHGIEVITIRSRPGLVSITVLAVLAVLAVA